MKSLFRFAGILSTALSSVCFAPSANAQYSGLLTDLPVVTVGHGYGTGPTNGTGYCTNGAAACLSTYGSLNSTQLVDGLTVVAFADFPGAARAGEAYLRTLFTISGFTADPGKSSLGWADCGGVIFRGAQASLYSYASGRATWSWNKGDGAQPAFQGKTSVSCKIYRVGDSGWVRPKYQIAGLTYAPPGSRSSVTYQSGFMSGTSTSRGLTFMNGVTYTESASLGSALSSVFGGSGTVTTAGGWTQTKESTTSLSLTQQTSNGLIVPGPASSAAGVNHDYDTIYVWLNPEIFMMVFNTSVVSGGYGYDARDPVIGMDVVPLTVGQLKGIQPIPPNLWSRLNRSWDTDLGGLTTVDFQDIVKANPFATNPGFNPNTDTSKRFEQPLNGNPPLPSNLIINYAPAPPGGQPNGQTYASSYSSTTAAGKTATDSYESSYSIDQTGTLTYYGVRLTARMATTTKWSTTNKWSSTVTNGTSQSANFTIFPPFSTDNYTGPTAIQVWKDNVYGTFMFYPLY